MVMKAPFSTPSPRADANSGGWPGQESQSSNGVSQAAPGGSWIEAPQPHEVPSTRLGRVWQHQACQPVRTIQNQAQMSDGSHSAPGYAPSLPEQGTTVIVNHLPDRYDVTSVLKLWPADGTFNYLEVPFSASEKCYKGRAIIHFVTHELAMRFVNTWNGRWMHPSQRAPLEVSLARIQGLFTLILRFQGKDIQKLNKHGRLPLIFDGMKWLKTVDVFTMLFHQ
mmetsp:Transcript_17940/g.37312  ORF Transcript_17940/g.37312 Transcript_17940/m.37312 type:complete len:223 (-) Transcript_17940:364-1032(-)